MNNRNTSRAATFAIPIGFTVVAVIAAVIVIALVNLSVLDDSAGASIGVEPVMVEPSAKPSESAVPTPDPSQTTGPIVVPAPTPEQPDDHGGDRDNSGRGNGSGGADDSGGGSDD